MIHDIIFLILGLALVLAGANYMTDGASDVAKRFHVSDLIIGMTIVAFGSSTPDLVISLTSTIQNHAALAVGDIVGANIFDILLVVGVCALVRPVVIGRETLQKEFPMVILSSAILLVVACDMLIDGATTNLINRSDGIIMLCFFAINCYVTYMISKSPDTPSATAGNTTVVTSRRPIWLSLVMIAGGLAGLIVGGNWFVSAASKVAVRFGMTESLVGLTIAAIGSSLPDLSTSLVATIKGHSGIAIGNVVGSCVLNVFFTIGLCSVVKPLQLGTLGVTDFAVLLGSSILMWIFGWVWGKRTINRPEGAILVLCYLSYMAYLILSNK